jgi:hypothetical protein
MNVGYKQNWYLCGYIKILEMLLGQLGGYTNFPSFLYECGSRARNMHWTRKDWPE